MTTKAAITRNPSGASAQRASQSMGHRAASLPVQAFRDYSSGKPMPGPVRQRMESAFGTRFADVRVHVDDAAPSLGAVAYTRGSEIHFSPGRYNPASAAGERVLGHELAHVVQQRQGRVRANANARGLAINTDHSLESQADAMWRSASRSEGAASSAAGDHAGAESAPVVQGWGLSSLTQYLPSVPERAKEYVDPRRWRINPFWQYHNRDEVNYEAGHGRYHSRERHGAEHTLTNIHARTQPQVAGGPAHGPSAMQNVVNPGMAIPRHHTSGRFATPAWHRYSRNVAIDHATANLPAGVTFPAGAPPAGIPAGNYHKFNVTYNNTVTGTSVTAPGVHTAAPTSHVFTGVQHDPATNQAWIVQHFPVPAPLPQGPAPAIPNHNIAYDQVPWFGTT